VRTRKGEAGNSGGRRKRIRWAKGVEVKCGRGNTKFSVGQLRKLVFLQQNVEIKQGTKLQNCNDVSEASAQPSLPVEGHRTTIDIASAREEKKEKEVLEKKI